MSILMMVTLGMTELYKKARTKSNVTEVLNYAKSLSATIEAIGVVI